MMEDSSARQHSAYLPEATGADLARQTTHTLRMLQYRRASFIFLRLFLLEALYMPNSKTENLVSKKNEGGVGGIR